MRDLFRRPTNAFIVITITYICFNLLIIAFKDPTASLRLAADGGSWFLPAKWLLEHGNFSLPEHPDLVFYRSPGVHVFFAGLMYLVGGASVPAIIAGQVCALYVTAVLFRMTVKDWFPDYADLGMALILFNPNLLAMAYFVQSDILATFTAMIALFFLLRYVKGSTTWTVSVALGLSLGVTCLVRTNPIYLIYVLPLAFPIISWVQQHAISARLAFLKGIVAMGLAVLVIAPWALKIYEKTGIIGASAVISPRAEYEFVLANLVHLESVHSKVGYKEAGVILRGPGGPLEKYIQSLGPQWEALTADQQFLILKHRIYKMMLNYPVRDWLTALGISWFHFYLGGGAGHWHNLFDAFPSGLVQMYKEMPKTEILAFIHRVLVTAPYAALAISAICFSFVFVTRIAFVAGIFEMSRRRMWGLMLTLLGVILYFSLSAVLQGQARYRASVEPAFMMIAIAGISYFMQRFRKHTSADMS